MTRKINVRHDNQQKRPLVLDIADQLRDIIFSCEPNTQIGSLNELAVQLGVGIVTVQQAARVLEHEGLLEVKRGPGGGYYGVRPDDSTLERVFASYLRVHSFNYREAFEILILLDCEAIPAAASSGDEQFRHSVLELMARLDRCEQPEDRVQFERDLRDALFRVAKKPFLEFLARVTLQLYALQSKSLFFSDAQMIQYWKTGRFRILQAILRQDEKLARFEAERYREVVLSWLRTDTAAAQTMHHFPI